MTFPAGGRHGRAACRIAATSLFPYSLADDLLQMDAEHSLPRDLPGRYGRVIRDLELLLNAAKTEAVIAGGWAVWHHGYAGRVTQDVDVVVPSDVLSELARLASLFGFEYLQPPEGRWPKLQHPETNIDVDLLPEFGIPGTPSRPAPVPIAHPQTYGATVEPLQYITLPGLVELKLGAGRAKDIADIIELIKAHSDQVPIVQQHLSQVHPSYADRFAQLVQQAKDE